MLNIGCHLSVTKGFAAMGRTALEIGASTFQFFTRNPRGGAAKAIDAHDVQKLIELSATRALGPFLGHAPYTLNPCSAEEKTRAFALQAMQDDLERMEYLPGNLYNFHPGSHVGLGTAQGIQLIIDQLNHVLKPEMTTTVLLETMAGKGSEIGRTFEELRTIIAGVEYADKLGVCLDTCHVHDAGYDIVGDLDAVLTQFDGCIGLQRLRAIHINDSLNPRGARKDRHAKIGEGFIGIDALARIINHPNLRALPFYLETPNELPGYAEEIRLLRSLWQN